jgi:hypothetical protein
LIIFARGGADASRINYAPSGAVVELFSGVPDYSIACGMASEKCRRKSRSKDIPGAAQRVLD